jgi:hypothetical protein
MCIILMPAGCGFKPSVDVNFLSFALPEDHPMDGLSKVRPIQGFQSAIHWMVLAEQQKTVQTTIQGTNQKPSGPTRGVHNEECGK